MYRIQAFNYVGNYMTVHTAQTMTERDQVVAGLLASGKYAQAGITIELLARCD
jgi:hypothetical protein